MIQPKDTAPSSSEDSFSKELDEILVSKKLAANL